MHSLKKSSYLILGGVAALLIFVGILCVRQFQLTQRYNTIIVQSEDVLFQFSTIREQVTASLIEKDWQKTVNAADQLKNLNSSLARLQENPLIPGEYRLDMAKQVDLTGLVLSSKEILTSNDKVAHSLNLQRKMRTLAEYLMQFDRIIVSQMRANVVQFQTVMIGALAGVICLISFSLILFYKKTMLPLLRLSRQTSSPDVLVNGFICDEDAWSEITEFIHSVNELLWKGKSTPETEETGRPHDEQLAAILNESTNLSNGIINYAQLLTDSYREVGIGEEETKILHNIIDAAERIARLNRDI